MRILVLIVIGLLLYIIIGNLFRRKGLQASKERATKMVKCHHCSLHILEEEAIHSANHYYCSQEHFDAK